MTLKLSSSIPINLNIGLYWSQVNLLDMKRSMQVNIFLKQFKKEPEEIVQLINKGDDTQFGDGKLKALYKILPDKEEVNTGKKMANMHSISKLYIPL